MGWSNLDVPTELVVYPGAGHGLGKQNPHRAKMAWDLAWFEGHLLGKSAVPAVTPATPPAKCGGHTGREHEPDKRVERARRFLDAFRAMAYPPLSRGQARFVLLICSPHSCFSRFTSSGNDPCRCNVDSGKGGGNRGLRRKLGRQRDACSVESLESRRFLTASPGAADALLLWQSLAPAGQLPPVPPAAVSNASSAPTTLVVAPIAPPLSGAAGSLLSAPAGQSPIGPGGSSLGSGGLLGCGPVTSPSGGSSSSGTSPTGTPSDSPYSGGGQQAVGKAGNVEDQLARTWGEYGQDWYDWAKPGLNIIWGIGQTAIDALTPPGLGEAKGVLEVAPPAARAAIIAAQQRRVAQAIAESADGTGPRVTQELEELRRLQELDKNPAHR